ncbi:tRNA-specific adenosine deaminase subunit tad2 protein [Rutstroemia sp. NJR-2017a BBW]|nr:tRNA-specific adenosine deaminase subunit tad2 protein [Rutstroemia sp. NJR-2017a BBW]
MADVPPSTTAIHEEESASEEKENLNLPPDAKYMTRDEISKHVGFMREALGMANKALQTNETPVGCVLVDPKLCRVVGRGMNATNERFNGTRHAEFVAVGEVLGRWMGGRKRDEGEGGGKEEKIYGPEDLKDLDLYVTVEPCIMCASFLRQVGIRKVWFGAVNEKFGGTGGVLRVHEGNGRRRYRDGDRDRREEEDVVEEHREKRVKMDDEGSVEKEEGDYEVVERGGDCDVEEILCAGEWKGTGTEKQKGESSEVGSGTDG